MAPKIPSHTFTDEDKERQKQQILTWNPQLEDGFIFVKRDFLPTRDETLGKLQNIMEARGFRAMSYSGFTQHFFNPDTKANPPAEMADSESDEDLTSSQKRKEKKRHQGAATNYKKTHKLIADAANNPVARPRKAIEGGSKQSEHFKVYYFQEER